MLRICDTRRIRLFTCANKRDAPIARNSDNQLSERRWSPWRKVEGGKAACGPSVSQPARRSEAQAPTFQVGKVGAWASQPRPKRRLDTPLRLVRAGYIHGQRKSDDVPLQVDGKLHPHSIGKSFGYRQAQARSVAGARRVRPIESVEQRRRID